MLEQDHVRTLPRVQYEARDPIAAREASHPGELCQGRRRSTEGALFKSMF